MIKRQECAGKRIIERKLAERNLIHFIDEGKYKNFIFNNFVFLDPSLLKKACNNSKKKTFLKDAVISVTFMM